MRVLAICLVLTACVSRGADGETAVRECIANGVAYFKEIGSYPTLSDGRDAEAVAAERCRRAPTAFPPRDSVGTGE